MKLITFYGAFKDGLFRLIGEAFVIDGRTYAVHHGREPFDDEYHISEVATGFKLDIPRTTSKSMAVRLAKEMLRSTPAEKLAETFAHAKEARSKLKIINKS